MFQATDEQIAEWKAKYGEVKILQFKDKRAYLKKPDRKTIGYASTVGAKDPMKFNEIILSNCWLGGDDEIKTNDNYFMGAGAVIAGLVQFEEAELLNA